MFAMGLLGPNEQDVSDGRPEPQLNETDSGNGPVGVTVTVYVAGTPAITVAVTGAAGAPTTLRRADPRAVETGPPPKHPMLLSVGVSPALRPACDGTVS